MPFMPMEHVEEQHDSMPNVSMREYLASFFRHHSRALPPVDQKQGTVQAVLNHGLWVGRCPMDRCYGEVAVTSTWPLMVCVDCGAGWFDVEFPENKAEIVREVERRKKTGLGLIYANWVPGETVEDLRRQTFETEGI